MNDGPGLRVVIDSRLRNGEPGGAQQVIIGLARGLSRLPPNGDEYLFLAWQGHSDWLQPFVGGPCRIVQIAASRARALGRALRRVAAATGAFGRRPATTMRIPGPDKHVQALGADVIHFPLQRAFLTDTPSVYQPHDLQHLHLPEFFSDRVRASRDVAYRAFCAHAHTVIVMSQWGRDDLISNYGLPEEKVEIVPWAPLVREYPEADATVIERLCRRYALPDRFAYFPAHTYPHKNHLGLLRALARLRDTGLVVPLVCSGGRNEFFRTIHDEIRRLRLDNQVRFTGFVAPVEVHALYRAAHAVLLPTLFEGWGLPLGEAFAMGVPVACSAVTCLPEQSAGAALLFDPRDQSDIARAVALVWTDEALRARLAARGRQVVAPLSWDRTADRFRALYRKAAGRPLLEAARQC